MTKHLGLPILAFALSAFPSHINAQYQRNATYVTPHGNVHVYEIPRRDRDDYHPTYEEAARRKADGYSLNSQELNALRRGSGAPKPGSIDEAVLLQRQKAILRNKVESDVQRIEAGAKIDTKRTETLLDKEAETDIERMKAQHELELQQKRAELELKLEYERKMRELKSDKSTQKKRRPLIIEVEDAKSSASDEQ